MNTTSEYRYWKLEYLPDGTTRWRHVGLRELSPRVTTLYDWATDPESGL